MYVNGKANTSQCNVVQYNTTFSYDLSNKQMTGVLY